MPYGGLGEIAIWLGLMGTIEIVTAPHEIIVNGTKILMKADPTAGKAWGELMELRTSWRTEQSRQEMHEGTLEALAAMAETPEDADTLRSLFPFGEDTEVGTQTLKTVGLRYVEVVTGFPTRQ